jgi:prophage regulatory protein
VSLNEQSPPVQPTHGATPQPHDGGATVNPAKPGKLLRLPAVEERTGLKKSTIYAGVKAKTFPAPVRLSARAVAFREEDIDRWISGRVNTGGQS